MFEDQLKLVKKMKNFASVNQFNCKEIQSYLKKTQLQKENFAEFAFFQNYSDYLVEIDKQFKNTNSIFQRLYEKAIDMEQTIIEVFKQSKNIYKESKDIEEKNHDALCQLLIGKYVYLFKNDQNMKQSIKEFDKAGETKHKLNQVLKLLVRYFIKASDNLEDEIDKTIKSMIKQLQDKEKEIKVKNSTTKELSFEVSQPKIHSKDQEIDLSCILDSQDKKQIEENSQDLLSAENQDLISMTNTLNQHLSSKSDRSFKFKSNDKQRRHTLVFKSDIRLREIKPKELLTTHNEYDLQDIDVKSQKKASHHNLNFLTMKEMKQNSETRASLTKQISRKKQQHQGRLSEIPRISQADKFLKRYQRKNSHAIQ